MVSVSAGVYAGNVTIDKSLTLQGNGAGSTVIQGAGTGFGISLTGGLNGVTIKDLTIQNFQDGIRMFSGPLTNILVQDVETIGNTRHGVWSQAFGITGVTFRQVNASFNDVALPVELVVNNVEPTVNAPGVWPEPSAVGVWATASATFSDPAGTVDDHTCTVDYGDGSGAQPGIASGMTCTGPAHAYASAGMYTVTVEVTDKHGDSDTNSVIHRVFDGNDCKKNGWKTLSSPSGPFKNRGDCVSYVATGGRNT